MEYAAIGLLLFMSAFFSSVETAFSSVNKIRLKHSAANGSKKAAKALSIAENFDRTLTTILVGNNIVNILSTSLGTVICTEHFGSKGVGIATALMTVLVLIFGEILPKSLAKEHAEAFALAAAAPLGVIITLLTPITFLLGGLKNAVAGLFKTDKSEPSVTEDELKYIIDEIEEEGVLEEKESDLVRSALEFDDRNVSEVLIPRVRISAVERHEKIQTIREKFFSEKYSRLPVFDKSIDNIIGFIHERDFFRMIIDDEDASDIESIIHDCLYITEFSRVSEALTAMQKNKVHLAVVKDQYGGTFGMVTMEDLIEELLGEIYDETDEEDTSFVRISDSEYDMAAEYSIRDMEERIGLPEDTVNSDSVTVGGWAMELFGRIPSSGDETSDGIFSIKILDAEDNRIVRLKVTLHDRQHLAKQG